MSDDRFHDACGVFGIFAPGHDVARLTYFGLYALQHRGQESAGIAVADEGLREWDYGVYEGRTSQEIQAEIPGWSVWKDAIVGGESLEQVGARADGVIARALAAAGPQTDDVARVARFAHAHILRILAARWIGLEARDGSLFVLGTGSVSVLGWEKETRVVQRWNREFEE